MYCKCIADVASEKDDNRLIFDEVINV